MHFTKYKISRGCVENQLISNQSPFHRPMCRLLPKYSIPYCVGQRIQNQTNAIGTGAED